MLRNILLIKAQPMESLTSLIPLVLITALSYLMLRGGAKIDRDWMLVQYNTATKVVSSLLFMLGLWGLYATAILQNKNTLSPEHWVLYIFIIFTVFGMNEVFRRKLWFDNHTIHYQSPYGKKVSLNYSEIVTIEDLKHSKSIRLTGVDGQKVEFSYFMTGTRELCEAIEEFSDKGKTQYKL